MKRVLVGAAAGFALGYAAVRTVAAVADLRDPEPGVQKEPRAYGRARRASMLAGIARSTAQMAVAAFALAPAATRDRHGRRCETPFPPPAPASCAKSRAGAYSA